ncbi:hypothetical protein SNE40_002428 [Patella caerulea]|uniref:Uncharacterized protein n=1 Tax=Patella caerulea TaxID=87958 RepID=A0AAN8K608_PATCE
MSRFIYRESYGSSTEVKEYYQSLDGSLTVIDKSPKFTTISQFFRSVFLPQGYPESVSEDYLIYQLWDTIQAFASSITGTLAARALLKGMGVGDENATVLAATMTWLLKDGTGMLGRIMFAWLKGSNLDCDAKRWRLFADILNDFAIFLEILAPNFKPIFTPIVCTAGVCKSIVGVAGGATRAALTQHQARRNNMADVSAKDGSQETLVNLAALICSLIIVPVLTGKDTLIWTLYILFTMLHLFANYSAVTSVVMATLNQARLHLLVKGYLCNGLIENTKIINYQEPVLWSTRRKFRINLGVSVQKICKTPKDVQIMEKLFQNKHYMIGLNLNTRCTNIVLNENCTTLEELEACYQAEVIEITYNHRHSIKNNHQIELNSIIDGFNESDVLKILQYSQVFTQKTFMGFIDILKSENWETKTALLCADEWRAKWDHGGLTDKTY